MTQPLKQSLSGEWQFRQAGTGEWLSASVPGGVHTDLMRAGLIDDPFVGDEELRVQWVARQGWDYRRTIFVDDHLLSHDRVQLVCDGLDTLATVSLNGNVIGVANNMFRPYRWDVRDVLHPGENEILITFASSVVYAAAQNKIRPMPDVNNPLPGAPHIRKAPSHFGWDWGPHLPPIGIWRDIRLEGYFTARLTEVAVRQHHANGTVNLTVSASADLYSDEPLQLTARLTSPQGEIQTVSTPLTDSKGILALDVADPQLWWPNGYGTQPLYTLDILLQSGAEPLDTRTYTIGLRTIELRQEPDEWGTSFTFVVNGVPIFAKGSNWIPGRLLPHPVTHAQLDHLIGSAAMAHHNMVRIWGGATTKTNISTTCATATASLSGRILCSPAPAIPLDEAAFLENVHGEVIDNVRRLRHSACLALWCGNNEIDVAWVEWGWNTPENAALMARLRALLLHHVLPEWVALKTPTTPTGPVLPRPGVP